MNWMSTPTLVDGLNLRMEAGSTHSFLIWLQANTYVTTETVSLFISENDEFSVLAGPKIDIELSKPSNGLFKFQGILGYRLADLHPDPLCPPAGDIFSPLSTIEGMEVSQTVISAVSHHFLSPSFDPPSLPTRVSGDLLTSDRTFGSSQLHTQLAQLALDNPSLADAGPAREAMRFRRNHLDPTAVSCLSCSAQNL